MAKAETNEKAILVKLSDTHLTVANRTEDIRGRKVLDRNREEVGTVDDLFIDQREHKVRFLELSSGGFLGLGGTNFMVPVEAITGITPEEVHIDKTREQLAGAPRYAPELVDERFLVNMYGYYGYSPYWGAGYVYPPYPYYPPVP